ncbi:unnamed protein product, partial [Sphenostylis stenocarpa]
MVMWWSIRGREVGVELVSGEGNLVTKTQKGSWKASRTKDDGDVRNWMHVYKKCVEKEEEVTIWGKVGKGLLNPTLPAPCVNSDVKRHEKTQDKISLHD